MRTEVGDDGGGAEVVEPVVVVTTCSWNDVVVSFGTVVVVAYVVTLATVVVVTSVVVVDAVVVVHSQLWSGIAPAATGAASTANVPIVAANTSRRLVRREVPTTRCTDVLPFTGAPHQRQSTDHNEPGRVGPNVMRRLIGAVKRC